MQLVRYPIYSLLTDSFLRSWFLKCGQQNTSLQDVNTPMNKGSSAQIEQTEQNYQCNTLQNLKQGTISERLRKQNFQIYLTINLLHELLTALIIHETNFRRHSTDICLWVHIVELFSAISYIIFNCFMRICLFFKENHDLFRVQKEE